MPLRDQSKTVWCVPGIVAMALASRAFAASSVITELGTLGGTLSHAEAISNSGMVTGYSRTAGDAGSHAFRYVPGQPLQDLGALNGFNTVGTGINDNGDVCGYGASSGWVYLGAGPITPIGTPADKVTSANGINNSRQVVGRMGNHAFRSELDGSLSDLGALGGLSSSAYAINDRGAVVGSADIFYDPAGGIVLTPPNQAFRYGPGGPMEDLGPTGGPFGFGLGINSFGDVVGHAFTPGTIGHAFRYTGAGPMQDLAPGTLFDSIANDINDTGNIVGNYNSHPVLWLADNSRIDLNAWLTSVDPVAATRWSLNDAIGINNAGLITGTGNFDADNNGTRESERAFVLNANSLLPEPGIGVALQAIAGLSICAFRRSCRNRMKRVTVVFFVPWFFDFSNNPKQGS